MEAHDFKFAEVFPFESDAYASAYAESFPEAGNDQVQLKRLLTWKFAKSNSRTWTLSAPSGEIAAAYSVIKLDYLHDRELLQVGLVCDVMTNPRFRRLGLFTRIGREVFPRLSEWGIDICVGYPVRDEVIPGHLSVGWRVAFECRSLRRPLTCVGDRRPTPHGKRYLEHSPWTHYGTPMSTLKP